MSVEDWGRADEALAAANVARRRRRSSDDFDAEPTARELDESEALDRLLKLVERLRNQSHRVHRATTWGAAAKALNAILGDHIGVSTWRERAWADGPAWQRNAADHVERIVSGLGELDHHGTPPHVIRREVGAIILPVRGDLADVREKIEKAGFKVASAEPAYLAKDLLAVPEDQKQPLVALLEALEADEDVKEVFTNALI